MKRPEGARPVQRAGDVPPAPRRRRQGPSRPSGVPRPESPPHPAAPAEPAAPRRSASTRPTRERAARPEPQRPKAAPPESPRRRTPQAEIRTAIRARRREERHEIKRFTRRTRRRRAGWITAGGVLVALVLLVVGAVYSPLLALRTISVDGTQRIDAADIRTALAPDLGTPLALLDEATITKQLSRFRLIRSYVTELQPPNTLVVHISERTPVGVIQGADDYQLVDPAGVVVERSAKRPDGVPLIQLGSAPVDGPGFASMAQVLLALPADLRAQVDTIAALTHDDVTLVLRGSGQHVVWGSADQSPLKAQVLAKLIALHGQSGSGTYTVSAPQFAVFNPGDPTAVGGTDASSGQVASPAPTGTSMPTPAPSDGGDQGGVNG